MAQTSTGARTQVTMVWNGGGSPPNVVNLSGSDGNVSPNASNQITVYSEYIDQLVRAGWSLVVPGVTTGAGTTHAP